MKSNNVVFETEFLVTIKESLYRVKDLKIASKISDQL